MATDTARTDSDELRDLADVERALFEATEELAALDDALVSGTGIPDASQYREAREQVDYLSRLVVGARARAKREDEAARLATAQKALEGLRETTAIADQQIGEAMDELRTAVTHFVESAKWYGIESNSARAEIARAVEAVEVGPLAEVKDEASRIRPSFGVGPVRHVLRHVIEAADEIEGDPRRWGASGDESNAWRSLRTWSSKQAGPLL